MKTVLSAKPIDLGGATPADKDVARRVIRLIRYALCWDTLDDAAQRQFHADMHDIDPNMVSVAGSIAGADLGERGQIAVELLDVMTDILARAARADEKILESLEDVTKDIVAARTGVPRERITLPSGTM